MQYFVGSVSPSSVEADNGGRVKNYINNHLIASCVRNTGVKNYRNLIIFLQITIENIQDFSGHSVGL